MRKISESLIQTARPYLPIPPEQKEQCCQGMIACAAFLVTGDGILVGNSLVYGPPTGSCGPKAREINLGYLQI